MMDIETLRQYCLAKKGAVEAFPFDIHTLVFKIRGKMFALIPLEKWEKGSKTVNLKCDPGYAEQLRAEYESIYPGYHMNKRHWNTVDIAAGEVSVKLLKKLIDHSYELVINSLPKHKRP